ncbi:MAG: sugar ABC transporter permease [Thermoprotei archaeon]|nr:MAG: sugar ABC transporter permease [Thermoprotei archaeon]
MLSEQKYGFLLVLPYIFFLIIIIAYPVSYNILLSLMIDSKFSFENYIKIFNDPIFPVILYNTLIWTLGSVVFQLLIGLGIALLLNKDFKGKKILSVLIITVPWAMPDVVAGASWRWMYSDVYGVINDILYKLGIIKMRLPWLGDINLAKIAVIIANIWKGFPISALMYLSALQAVPTELYEAAIIDGASYWVRFKNITLPLIAPVIKTTVMLTVIWTVNYFPLIYVMTGGGPANSTDTLVTYAYRVSFKFIEFNLGAAWATLTFIIMIIFAAIYLKTVLRGH